MAGSDGDLVRCSRCVLPETYPGISFDAAGVCNYCAAYRPSVCQAEAGLLQIVDRHRGRGGHDCVVALSGGRDSAFVAYYLVHRLGLAPLAVLCDNGFMPEGTRRNVEQVVSRLGIDLVVVEHAAVKGSASAVMSAWLHRPDPAMVAFLCNGCVTGIKRGLAQAARADGTSLIIGGGGGIVGLGGEPEQSFAEELLAAGKRVLGRPLSLLAGFAARTVRNPRYLLRARCLTSFGREFYYRFCHRYDRALEVVSLFEFIEWNESDILDAIQHELGWQKPAYAASSWRSDCTIHLVKEYLYQETLGFTKQDELLSGMVRENMITRETAARRLQDESKIPREHLAQFLRQLGVSLPQVDAALARHRRTLRSHRT